MSNILEDVIAKASEEDIKTIQAELGKQEGQPVADSSTANKPVENASTEASSEEETKASEKETTSTKEESQAPASEGEKTLSTEANEPKVKQRRTSQFVPYERFKEVNTKLQETLAELAKLRSSSSNLQQPELDELEQPYTADRNWIKQEVAQTVQSLLEPVITTLDKQMDEAEFNKALERHPEAEKYKKEIKAYADVTNLTYDDIVTLVLAKHSKPVSPEAVKQAELEAQEAELSGKSNSAARRKAASGFDIKQLSDTDLEKLIDQM